jgi:hypothetical protein
MKRDRAWLFDPFNLMNAWLDLLARLFEREGFVVSKGNQIGRSFDLSLDHDSEIIIVELKLHRSERVPLALVRNAFAQLDRIVADNNAQRGILIIPQRLVESHYSAVNLGPHALWDLNQLIAKTRQWPDLAADLAELLRALRVGAERQPEEPARIAELADTPAELPPLGAGEVLAAKLEAIPAGKRHGAAQDFEKFCEEALRLLFNQDLLGWRSQSEIENGFQRVDVIARLQPSQSAFWSTLSADFRTRYVVFEFKNYSDPITQDQVYTTEKYLFTLALRSVAIIIAKNGAAESADRAMRGALREQGKLILCLSMSEFCSLLRGFDGGDNPEEVLIQKVDDLLTTIGR